MSKLKLKLEQGVKLPEYKSEEAVGFDLAPNKILKVFKGDVEEKDKLEKIQESFLRQGYIKMRPFERVLFGTGIFAEIPEGFEIQIRSRSGTALKKGLMIANGVGTIDPDYTGELGIIIYNSSPFLNTVHKKDFIAQGVTKKVDKLELEAVETIKKVTERGEQGYGHTG